MELFGLIEKTICLTNPTERKTVEDFLHEQGLLLDRGIEYTMALLDGEQIIATGSLEGKVLKSIAVDKNYKGLGISNKVVSHLVNEAYQHGNSHLFIYTKPENLPMFKDLGFYKIVEVENRVVLLENRFNGIKNYVDELKKFKHMGKDSSSVVMNCNPFTLGHLYLIERAARESGVLHIFVVWEDKSSFPAEVRYHLIREGTKHLSNVFVHKGKDYIISSATFPSYFLKEYQTIVETHALLDLEIYSTYIVPALGITKRFVGEEPYCPVTGVYNETMKRVLPSRGIEVIEIPRLSKDDQAISASLVRKHLREGKLHKIKNLVPKTTYDFLVSKEAEPITKSIQKENRRH